MSAKEDRGGDGKVKSSMAGRSPASSPWGSCHLRSTPQSNGNGSTVSIQSPLKKEEEEKHGERSTGSPSPSSSMMMMMKSVGRRKDFKHMERVNGRSINILQGLELHTNVFSAEEQKKIVDCVHDLQEKGRKGQLRERTYTEPRKWMRGKGRVTIQFGCCYNYAVDKRGNPPGIVRDEQVDPLPPLLKSMIKRMVAWRVLPPTCVPNSCIINVYDKDDCIPPHIDHHDFVRPFCTVSFLTECKIIFGKEIKVVGPGDFSGSVAIPLPLGSVLILSGNGADVAKHCIPACPAKRISITFRRMDDSKLPFKFINDPELQNLRPIQLSVERSQAAAAAAAAPQIPHTPQQQSLQKGEKKESSGAEEKKESSPAPQIPHTQQQQSLQKEEKKESSGALQKEEKKAVTQDKSGKPFQLGEQDFPPLGSSSSSRIRSRTRPNN